MTLRTPAARPHGLGDFRPRLRTAGTKSISMSGLLLSQMATSLTLMSLGDMLTQYNARKGAATAE
eukprot:3648969-Rhodomonas_salina.1